ncbi:hypothetical protein PCL_11640 [Purpureocillium lilacinum]|uniref:Protein kinase domain-containing protein n=1 Tax=Purpureocillium lilacinum TaxID=33203 RepID=A0A2U3EAK9_PURLI|nr:hypothetical protein PCL_11640 [Purpureocillium lilacinum]
MTGLEIAGIPLAVGGLLLSVKGAVDGFNMIADVCAKDNGLRFASTQYYVEKVKLGVWARRFKVHVDDDDDEDDDKDSHDYDDLEREGATDSPLLQQPQVSRDAIWRIIAEINATHELAIKYISKFHVEPVALPDAADAGPQTFHRKSKWVTMLGEARARVPQRNRIRWVARHREQFTGLIARLSTLNQDLWDVVTREEVDSLSIVTGVLSGLGDQLSLASLQNAPGTDPASLLAFAARLKQLQGETVQQLAARVKRIDASELSFLNAESNDTTSRFRGTYTSREPKSLPEPVWIEWKAIENIGGLTSEIILRVDALGALLSTDNAAAFHRPACVGVFDDIKYRDRNSGNRRLGLVYRSGSAAAGLPVPLWDLLRAASKARTRPPLGARFELAYKLASAVSLFHATNWIHKSLRSDNILFTPTNADASPNANANEGVDITAPQIAGFQYSRPAADASLEGRPTGAPELDVYYHPEVLSGGWTKAKELYSLGVVLLEIAHWRPVFEERYRRMTMREVSAAMLGDVQGRFGDDLAGVVGRAFVDVIKCCLTGSFGVPGGLSAADEAKALSDAFFQKVVRPLATLKA